MPSLNQPILPKQRNVLAGLGVALAALAILLSLAALVRGGGSGASVTARDTSLDDVRGRGVLRVGYGLFPPYTSVDPKEADPAKRVQGFSIDVIKEIGARASPPLRVKFYPFSWDSLRPEVESRKFDVIADPVFQTIPRAMDFRLVRPYSYFGIAVALVKKDEARFAKFSDLDRADITIALAEGWTSSEFARQHLKLPKFKSIPVTGDAFTQLDEVRLGRADVALNDVPTVLQYARAHAGTVKALWIDSPPSWVPGSFLVRQEAMSLAAFLDSAVGILIADGTLQRLDQKWKTLGFVPSLHVVPGAGLKQ
jgi:polar amino acid transport system substrate-binding protein